MEWNEHTNRMTDYKIAKIPRDKSSIGRRSIGRPRKRRSDNLAGGDEKNNKQIRLHMRRKKKKNWIRFLVSQYTKNENLALGTCSLCCALFELEYEGSFMRNLPNYEEYWQ